MLLRRSRGNELLIHDTLLIDMISCIIDGSYTRELLGIWRLVGGYSSTGVIRGSS